MARPKTEVFRKRVEMPEEHVELLTAGISLLVNLLLLRDAAAQQQIDETIQAPYPWPQKGIQDVVS